MTDEQPELPPSRLGGMRNWISLAGLITVAGSIFAFILLFVADTMAPTPNPYIGILTYLVAPMFSTAGVVMIIVGFVFRARQLKLGRTPIPLVIDVSRPRDRRILLWFMVGGGLFLLISAVGTYFSFHFTESVTFCGEACHTIMEPERVTYSHSPHARVGCVQCHIGPGADWYVRSKLSGLYQVYATITDKYPRPVPTPIENLRPARDTCEQCHWPQRFSGEIVRTYRHYLSDEANTPHNLSVMLKVGGGDPDRGPVEGIHWHISPDNKVEYIATDDLRLEIPWVRLTQTGGRVTEYRAPGFTNDLSGYEIRTMDCIDCHNRPAHIYKKPNDAVDRAINMGWISRDLPSVRAKATELLTAGYETVPEAMEAIKAGFQEAYPDDPKSNPAIEAVQKIYRENFFPLMKAQWSDYPEHIGHKDWPGCVRCHDDDHPSADGTRNIGFQDCSTCHLILAQGADIEGTQPSLAGLEFQHPGEEWDPSFKCHDCHTGGP